MKTETIFKYGFLTFIIVITAMMLIEAIITNNEFLFIP